MMDGLSKFEKSLGKPRMKWTKADWRRVAHQLAGVQETKGTLGRPRLTTEQKYESEQNLKAAEFWRDQATQTSSVFDGDVGTVKVRPKKIDIKTAAQLVIREAAERGRLNLRRDNVVKPDALNRAIQVMKKNRRDK